MMEDSIKNMNANGLIFLNGDFSKRFPSHILLKIVSISNTGPILNFTFYPASLSFPRGENLITSSEV